MNILHPSVGPHPQVNVVTITSALFEENAYLLYLSKNAKGGGQPCLIVDPGLEPDRIIEAIESRGLTPTAIVCTHGHSDHIAGNEALKGRWPDCPLIIGAGDADKLTNPVANLSAAFGVSLTSPPADQTVDEGDELELAGIEWSVVETPGHSSGHVVLIAHGLTPMIVLGGDVLFAGSIGRSDFPDSNPEDLVESIQGKLYTLPDDTLVLTGHGPPTRVGVEKRTNPFVRGA